MKITRVRLFSLAVPAAAVVLATSVALAAHYRDPTGMPVDRLVKNAEAWIKENPDEAYGYATLARVHSYALRFNTAFLGAYRGNTNNHESLERLSIRSAESFIYMRKYLPGGKEAAEALPLTMVERKLHALAAMRNYAIALTIEPDQPEYHLGYAYTAELAAPMAALLDEAPQAVGVVTPEPSEDTRAAVDALISGDAAQAGSIRGHLAEAAPLLIKAIPTTEDTETLRVLSELLEEHWRLIAVHHYLRAFELVYDKDASLTILPPLTNVRDLLSYEGATSALSLVEGREPEEDSPLGKRLAAAREGAAKLETIPPTRGVMTPIIFSIERAAPLDQLLSDNTAVFDLDGDLLSEAWPWVQPNTAVLVWDPDRTGTITSGRQLFGSVTWWLFFPDGYRALDLLDDNRDGWLRGDELLGMALWFDRNHNGVSDPGEVIPIEDTAVAALSTHWDSRLGDSFANGTGLELKDGRLLPTYDWVAHPAVATQESSARTLADAARP